MPTIVLARHGKTDWNAAHRLQGHTDIPLNTAGQEQVVRMAIVLKYDPRLRVRRIVCSDLSRAYQSALVAAVMLEIPMNAIIRDPRLRECRFGALEGKPVDEARRLTGEPLDATEPPYPFDYAKWGGEDYLTVLARHLNSIMEYGRGLMDGPRANLLVVGHGRGLGALLHHFHQPSRMHQGTYQLLHL